MPVGEVAWIASSPTGMEKSIVVNVLPNTEYTINLYSSYNRFRIAYFDKLFEDIIIGDASIATQTNNFEFLSAELETYTLTTSPTVKTMIVYVTNADQTPNVEILEKISILLT